MSRSKALLTVSRAVPGGNGGDGAAMSEVLSVAVMPSVAEMSPPSAPVVSPTAGAPDDWPMSAGALSVGTSSTGRGVGVAGSSLSATAGKH